MLRIYYFAAAQAAAGVEAEEIPDTLADVRALRDFLCERHAHHTTPTGTSFREVLRMCSFLVDGSAAQLGTPLAGVKRVDVMPPFAGG